MGSIDKRIVDMQFNNRQFQEGIRDSLKSLDNLKKGLNLEDASKSLSSLEDQGNRFSLAAMGESVQAIADRFSTLGIIGMTVLQNLTTSAMNFVSRAVSAVGGMISSGGRQRAINIEQAKFQFKGLGLDVEAAMASASEAVDGTAYGLDAAAKAAAQFGASGMQAGEEMTSALRAISGVAAMTSSEYDDIANIFTTVAGNGRLMGDQLRQLSARGVNAAATLGKAFGKTEAEIRDMVSKGQISFEMFYTAMDEAFGEHAKAANDTFTGAMSNVRAALSRIGANVWTPALEDLRDIFNALRPAINDVNKALEPLYEALSNVMGAISSWSVAKLEGLDLTAFESSLPFYLETIKGLFDALMSVVRPIKQAFREIFPPRTADQIIGLAKALSELVQNFKIGEENADRLRRTFKGVFAIFDIAATVIKALAQGFFDLIGYAAPVGDFILEITARIGDLIVRFRDFLNSSDVVARTIRTVVDVIKSVVEGIKTFVGEIVTAFKEFANIDTSGFDEFSEKVQTRFQPLTFLGDLVKKSFEVIGGVVRWLTPLLSKLAGIAGRAFGALGDAISNAFSTGSLQPILDLVNGGIFAGILWQIKNFLSSSGSIFEGFSTAASSISGVLDIVRGSLQSWQESIKANTLMKIATALGILAISLLAISFIDSSKLASSLGAVAIMLTELFASMAIFSKIMASDGFGAMGRVTTSLILLSVAVLVLSSAVKKLAELDWDGLAKGLVGVATLSAVLVASAKVLSTSQGKLIKGATGLVIFAAAIRVLATAVTAMSGLDWDQLAVGLVGVGALLTELAIFLKVTDLSGGGLLKSVGLLALAGSIKILAGVVQTFSDMGWEDLAKGLATIGALLLELAIFSKLTSNSKHVFTTAVSMTVLGAAMHIFAAAIRNMSGLSWEQIGKGLTTVAGALLAVTVAMNLMPKGMINKSLGIIGMAAGLLILSNVIRNMSGLSWEEIARGMVVLAGSMLILVASLKAMKGTAGAAASMLVLSAALAIFTPMLKILSGMSWEEIARGLTALAGAFLVIGVAGTVLRPLTKTLLAISGAMVLFGVAIAAIGAGVLALSIGLGGLAVSGASAAGALVIVITSVLSLIPMFFEQVGKGIISLAKIITKGAPAIAEAFKALVLAGLDAIMSTAPQIAEGVLKLIDELLGSLVTYTPSIVKKLMEFIIGLLDGVADKMPDLIKAGANLIGSFLTGVIDVLGDFNPENIGKAIGAVGALIGLFVTLAAVKSIAKNAIQSTILLGAVVGLLSAMLFVLSFLPVDTVLPIILGLSVLVGSISASMLVISLIPISGALTGIAGLAIVVGGLTAILIALGALAQIPGLSWLMDEGVKLLGTIGEAIGVFVGSIVGGFLGSASSGFADIGENLSLFMEAAQPFFDGVKNIDEQSMNGIKALADTVLILTAANVLDGLTSWFTGGNSFVKFGQELAEFAPYLISYADQVKGLDSASIQASANAALTLAEFASNVPNSGGVASWFAGENSLTEFAEELSEFGPSLMAYADSVQGLNADVVTNSANAAMALAEMGQNLPNQGGVVEWFTGTNSLSVFAEELLAFGPSIKTYADSVKGLDASVVKNSASAGAALGEMAKNLPNSGGVASWFAGDNLLSEFGEELVMFGPSIKTYADSVTGLDSAVVVNSANAAKALAELATNLPSTGGIGSWFGGDNNIGDFGKDLVKFGEAFADYYASVAGIDFSKVSGVVREVTKLIELVSYMSDVNWSGVNEFKSSMKTLGNTGIDGFIESFTESGTKVESAWGKTLELIRTSTTSKRVIFVDAGRVTVAAFITGIKAQQLAANSAMSALLNGVIGQTLAYQNQFTVAGINAANGFINGVLSKLDQSRAAGKTLADEALKAAQRRLDSHSPSREFQKLGDWSGEGFVIGLLGYSAKASEAGAVMADEALEGFKDVIQRIAEVVDGDIDASPVITPVLDLSSVQAQARSLDTLLTANRTAELAAQTSAMFEARRRSNVLPEQGASGGTGDGETKIEFVQNNYSPRELSRIEIYRQTNNLLYSAAGKVAARR